MKTNAMDLPDECWELIFNPNRVVGLHDYHLDSISLVCKRFLSISNSFRRTLTISDPRILCHDNLSKLFRRFNNIKLISIQNCRLFDHGELDRIIVEIARSGLNLEELNLSSPEQIVEDELADMIAEVSLRELGLNMKNLKTLKCKYCSLNDNDLIAIMNSLPRLQELDITDLALDLYNFPLRKQFVTDEKMLELTSKLKELRKINISGYNFSSERSIFALSLNCARLSEVGLAELHISDYNVANASIYAVRYFSNLSSLSVLINYLEGSSALSNIGNYLSHARALRALEFTATYLSDALLASIAEAHLPLKKLNLKLCLEFTFSGLSLLLHEYQSLNEISLEQTEFLTDQHMNHLSKYLSNLTHIDLSFCLQLTNSTFFTLARSCPLLVSIVMNGTSLGRKESEIPADYLKKNNQIQRLEMRSNHSLNDESLKKIGYVCPNLQMLDLSDCLKITEKGIGEILKSCSNIRHLKVNWCKRLKMIVGAETEHSKLNIEVLEAEKCVSLNEKAMTMIGMRCPGLLKLNLNFSKVSEEGVMEVVEKCSNLREIQLSYCGGCSTNVLHGMSHRRSSLRKIIINSTFCSLSKKEVNLSIRHGCRVYFYDDPLLVKGDELLIN